MKKQIKTVRRKKQRRIRRAIVYVGLWSCLLAMVLLLGTVVKVMMSKDDVQQSNAQVMNPSTPKVEYPENWDSFIKQYPEASKIYDNKEAYPSSLLDAMLRNPELIPFVEGYIHAQKIEQSISIMAELQKPVSKFYQWDQRWGYLSYGDSIMGLAGCGPTALSIVITSLTHNSKWNPYAVASYAEANGYYVDGVGTSWALMSEGATYFDVNAMQIANDEQSLKNVIDQGGMVIASVTAGDFTTTGHFIVIHGYDQQGNFLIQDPYRKSTSDNVWTFTRLSPQFANLWAYYADA